MANEKQTKWVLELTSKSKDDLNNLRTFLLCQAKELEVGIIYQINEVA